ncbi:mycothiol acetyltransferase [Cellulomonas chitinilytica]|uniref:Mycothiol acetyltransferase n=2 Tax=Cellulomonas chitinilytica TaxID=398759 RepID=A0A919U1Z5_9CELL|nr:mycothiol acetyltransferase [Cellulomonas chitinilytica]
MTAGPLDARTAGAVRGLAARATAADRVAPLSEQPLLWLTDPEPPAVHVCATDASGEVVGYAQADVGAATWVSAELVVDPSRRRTGIGSRLLGRLRSEAAVVPGRTLQVWAHGDLPAARAFAGDAGMVVVRELWRMRLDLTSPRPERPLPQGVRVRPFVPGQDEEAWRRVNSRAFAYHPEQGRMTSNDLRAREAEPWFDPAGFLLAEREGALLGSVWTKVHPSDEGRDDGHAAAVGEIYVVGVDPDAQGLGLGGALTALGLDHLAARGLSSAILYTGAENTVAIRTYTRLGFTKASADVKFGYGTQGSPSGVTMST